jgi:hypothetical protein
MIGLPSLRSLDGAQATRIWLAAEPTDMRCRFDRLAERVKAVISQGAILWAAGGSGKRELEEPLAGKSTLNRLELAGRTARYHKISYSADAIDQLLVDVYLESHATGARTDRARSGCHRHPHLRSSAGALLPRLLRQLLLFATVHLRR